MKSFTDAAGRTWDIHVDVTTIHRVRSRTEINLLDIYGGGLHTRLLADLLLLADILWAIVQPDADRRGIAQADFFRELRGDPFDAATRALLEELTDFSPSPKERANLRALIDKTDRAVELAQEVIARRIEELGEKALQQIANASSGNAPESLDAIPDPSPSAS